MKVVGWECIRTPEQFYFLNGEKRSPVQKASDPGMQKA